MQRDRPGILATKAIAEEGFMYGLPLGLPAAVRVTKCNTGNI